MNTTMTEPQPENLVCKQGTQAGWCSTHDSPMTMNVCEYLMTGTRRFCIRVDYQYTTDHGVVS